MALVVGSAKLTDATTAHYKALHWLLHDDPLQLPKHAPNLIQRYALALFYYETTTRGPWRSCNPPVIGSSETHKCFFQQLKWVWPELQFDTIEKNRWLSRTHECDWVGITCEGDTVQHLVLGELCGSINVCYLAVERFTGCKLFLSNV